MKRLVLLSFLSLIINLGFSQSPEGFTYQSILRDSNGDVVPLQNVDIRFSILQGSSSGPSIYTETHTTVTNDYGLINLFIGQGTTSDDLSLIIWNNGPYFAFVEADPDGSGYQVVSTTQMMSVPFALYAKYGEDADIDPTNEYNTGAVLNGTDLEIIDAGGTQTVDLSSLQDGVDDADNDPTNEYNTGAVLSGTDLEITDAGGTQTVDLSSLSNSGTDDQNISGSGLAGTTLTIGIENGTNETVDLSSLQDGVDDADNDPTNEYNTGAVLSGTDLEITDAGGTQTVDLSSLSNSGTDDQNISGSGLAGTTLTIGIENGTNETVDLSSLQDGVDDADNDPTNEYNTGAVLSGTDLEITDAGGTQTVDLSSLQDGVDDADNDPTNEYNTGAVLSGTDLEITDAGGTQTVDLSSLQDGVDDADNDPTNEYNTSFVLNGTNLEITDAGGTQTVDVISLTGTGTDDQNLTGATLTGTSLQIDIESGTSATVDLAGLQDGVDDADNDPTNEYNTGAVLSGTDLEITDAGGTQTVDLSSLFDDGDWIVSGNDIYNANSRAVGIGDITPDHKLDVELGTALTTGDTIVMKSYVIHGSGTGTANGTSIQGYARTNSWSGTANMIGVHGYAEDVATSVTSRDISVIGVKGEAEATTFGTTEAIGGFFTASGADNNYAGIFENGDVGIGTTTPSEKLDVVGNIEFSGSLEPNALPGSSGEVLVSQGAGVAPVWQAERDLVNLLSVVGTTDISITAGPGGNGFVLMDEMTITFTPNHTPVMVNFTAGGTYTSSNYDDHSIWFEMRKDGVSYREFDTGTGVNWNLWEIGISYPVDVTVGVSTTISIYWDAARGSAPSTSINCIPASVTYSARALQIIDAP